MTTIFVSHTKEDADCAEHIRQNLEDKEYSTWREPESLTLESILYPKAIEGVILGSAAIVLLWSTHAAQSEWVERHILFAQHLKKAIFPVVLDGTSLPSTLIIDTPISNQSSCVDTVAWLIAQPNFPQPESTDSLILLSEKAAHKFIRTRKEAVDQAAEMLKRGEHQEAVLAVLEYLSRHDLIMGVREKAQEALDADAKKIIPAHQSIGPDDSRHKIGMRCKLCGHVSNFDKRHICSAQSQLLRHSSPHALKELDEMELPCENCGHKMPTHVDCEGYK